MRGNKRESKDEKEEDVVKSKDDRVNNWCWLKKIIVKLNLLKFIGSPSSGTNTNTL